MKRILTASAVSVLLLAACGGDDGGSASGGDFCDQMAATKASFDAVDDDDVPFDDPAALESLFTTAANAIANVAKSAPDEIEDDFALLSSTYADVVKAMDAVDFDFVKLMADPEASAALEAMDSEELEAAMDRVNEYTKTECGIDMEEGNSSDDTVAPEETTDDTTAESDGESSDTVPFSDVSIPLDGTEIEMAAAMFQQMFGIDEAAAMCLAEKTDELGVEADTEDPTAIFAVLDECGITMEDIMAATGTG